MSCTACSKSYGFFTKEVGCPNCGFSFCTKCLKKTIEVPKLKNAVHKVCLSCYEKLLKSKPIVVQSATTTAAVAKESPTLVQPNVSILDLDLNVSEQEALPDVDEEIKKRLHVIKQPLIPEEVHSESDIGKRLANLKGLPYKERNNIDALHKVDKRTEQEKSNDLIKQFWEENEIGNGPNAGAAASTSNDFDIDDDPIKSIERRLAALKGTPTTSDENKSHSNDENEDEETVTNRIVKRYLEEAKLPNSELTPEEKEYVESIKQTEDVEELPWCTICNEDASIRCDDCDGDLFCAACFKEIHADDEEYREHKTKKYVAPEKKIDNL